MYAVSNEYRHQNFRRTVGQINMKRQRSVEALKSSDDIESRNIRFMAAMVADIDKAGRVFH